MVNLHQKIMHIDWTDTGRIGEKFLEWSDKDPSLDDILTGVTLYWFTDAYPRTIYPYRGMVRMFTTGGRFYATTKDKPLGYSAFREPIVISPKSWAESAHNLVWYREQLKVSFKDEEGNEYKYANAFKGGHFAALEQPQALLKDVEEFAAHVWVKTG